MKTNISIAVFSIVALAGVVMLAIIGMSRYSSEITAKAQADILRVGELNFALGRFEVDFLLARRAEKDFLLRLDEKYAHRHADTIVSLYDGLEDIKVLLSQTGGQDATISEVASLKTAIDDYQRAFLALTDSKRRLGLDERSGLQGQLRQSVHGIEAALQQSDRHELTAKMLMMRRHEKDFILRNDAAYLGALNTRVEEFRSFPPSYFGGHDQQLEIYRLLTAYQSAFTGFVLETFMEHDLRKTLSQKYAEVEPILNIIHLHALTRLKKILSEGEVKSLAAQKFSLITGLVGFVVFVVIALVVARAISKPLRHVNGALHEMAHGDFSRALPSSHITEIAAVSNAIKDFRGARDKALAAERAKANLLTVMSHEMRTPLTGVLGSMELLDSTSTTAEQNRYLQAMRVSGELLLHHVNEVLELSGLDADISERKSRSFDIEELMVGLVNSQMGNARSKGNTLDLHCRMTGSSIVVGRPTQVQKAMLNLIGNALKFTNNGTVIVEVKRQVGSNLVEFVVSDTGIGIAPSDLKRIFEDFVTLNTDYGRKSEGTGLGLAITQRIVESLGGSIKAESKPGKGSRFRVLIPLPATPVEQKREPTKTKILPVSRRILIAEDNDINRVLLDKTLQNMGHQVTTAEGGAEAVEAARKGQFDLILMDISMPRVDGIEAHGQIRDQMLAEGVPIVALTAHVAADDQRRILDAGFSGVATKPISKADLEQLVSTFTSINT